MRTTLAPVIALAMTGVLLLLGAGTASAQGVPPTTPATPVPTPEPPPVIVSTTSPLPLLIDGRESDKLPGAVAPGTRVCVTDSLYYKTEGERWTFQGWSTGSDQECITPTRPGTYRAIFLHEVLVVVRSSAAAFQHSDWVPYGVPVDVEVPATAPARDDNQSRYRFVQWSDGETPFDSHNRIAPVKPTTLDIKWVLEHHVTVNGPADAQLKGTNWYPDGTNLVLQAPDILPVNDGERLKFKSWQSVGFPVAMIGNPATAQATLKVDAPYTVQAQYDKQWFVTARTPAGTLKRDWIADGQELTIEAPAVLDVIPDRERLVFKRWDGIDGILSPKFGGPVDRPVSVSAVYERELMLKVDAPNGVSGDGWKRVGTVATVSVPPAISNMFLFKSTFAGFSGYPPEQASVQVLMSEPVTLSAVYRNEIDLRVLAVLLLVPFVATVLILSYRWIPALWRMRPRRRLPSPDESLTPMPRRGGATVTPLQQKNV